MQDGADTEDWGKLSVGGKDGLFLVVMTLVWWIRARDPAAADCRLDDTIHDVSWVMRHLITSLSVDVTTRDSSPPATPPLLKTGKSNPIKIGPPKS